MWNFVSCRTKLTDRFYKNVCIFLVYGQYNVYSLFIVVIAFPSPDAEPCCAFVSRLSQRWLIHLPKTHQPDVLETLQRISLCSEWQLSVPGPCKSAAPGGGKLGMFPGSGRQATALLRFTGLRKPSHPAWAGLFLKWLLFPMQSVKCRHPTGREWPWDHSLVFRIWGPKASIFDEAVVKKRSMVCTVPGPIQKGAPLRKSALTGDKLHPLLGEKCARGVLESSRPGSRVLLVSFLTIRVFTVPYTWKQESLPDSSPTWGLLGVLRHRPHLWVLIMN